MCLGSIIVHQKPNNNKLYIANLTFSKEVVITSQKNQNNKPIQ